MKKPPIADMDKYLSALRKLAGTTGADSMDQSDLEKMHALESELFDLEAEKMEAEDRATEYVAAFIREHGRGENKHTLLANSRVFARKMIEIVAAEQARKRSH